MFAELGETLVEVIVEQRGLNPNSLQVLHLLLMCVGNHEWEVSFRDALIILDRSKMLLYCRWLKSRSTFGINYLKSCIEKTKTKSTKYLSLTLSA